MRRSGIVLVLMGIVVAILSGWGAINYLQSNNTPPPPEIKTVQVVIATKDIPERTQLQATMVALKEWPADYMPMGAMTDTIQVVGKVTTGPVAEGEVLVPSKISGELKTAGLAPLLPPGLVAMSLAMSPVQAVGGTLRTGDFVDILVSLDYSVYNVSGDESKSQYTTFYTIQDVPIAEVAIPDVTSSGSSSLAAPSNTDTTLASRKAPTTSGNVQIITVVITPQDALLIKHARERGSVDFVLRSSQSHNLVNTDPVYTDYIVRRFELPAPLIIHRPLATGAKE